MRISFYLPLRKFEVAMSPALQDTPLTVLIDGYSIIVCGPSAFVSIWTLQTSSCLDIEEVRVIDVALQVSSREESLPHQCDMANQRVPPICCIGTCNTVNEMFLLLLTKKNAFHTMNRTNYCLLYFHVLHYLNTYKIYVRRVASQKL